MQGGNQGVYEYVTWGDGGVQADMQHAWGAPGCVAVGVGVEGGMCGMECIVSYATLQHHSKKHKEYNTMHTPVNTPTHQLLFPSQPPTHLLVMLRTATTPPCRHPAAVHVVG